MEDTNLQPISTPPIITTASQPVLQPTQIPPKQSHFLRFFFIGLALVLFGVLVGVTTARFLPLASTSSTPTPTPTATITTVIPPSVTPTPTIDVTADWQTYTNSEAKYEIKYPTDATLSIAKTVPSVDITFFGQAQPKTQSSLSNGYKVIISYEFTAPTETLSSASNYVHQHAAENCSTPKGAVVSSIVDTKISGEPAMQFSVDNCDGDNTRYFFLKGDKLFTITAVYAAEAIDQRMHFKEQATQVVSTFKFNEAATSATSSAILK